MTNKFFTKMLPSRAIFFKMLLLTGLFANYSCQKEDLASGQSQNYNQESEFTAKNLVPELIFHTESHFMEANYGCYKVQVNVFMTFQGQTSLVSSGIAYIGDCPPKEPKEGQCVDGNYKGDFVTNTPGFERCLIDCLEDPVIYNLYTADKNRILANY